MDTKTIPCTINIKCHINNYVMERKYKIWCCHEHAQSACDAKNNKSKKISKKDTHG